MYDFVKKVNNINTTDTSNIVRKTDYQRNISEIENKMNNHDHTEHITTQELNKLTIEKFTARLA